MHLALLKRFKKLFGLDGPHSKLVLRWIEVFSGILVWKTAPEFHSMKLGAAKCSFKRLVFHHKVIIS